MREQEEFVVEEVHRRVLDLDARVLTKLQYFFENIYFVIHCLNNLVCPLGNEKIRMDG